MSSGRLSRRAFLQLAVAAPVLADLDAVSGLSRTQARQIASADPWQKTRRILARIKTDVSGPIRLKSRVNLHLAAGAVLKFSANPQDYLPAVSTRFEGTELMNYSPFIYAYGEQDGPTSSSRVGT
jgi:hypothetical protein